MSINFISFFEISNFFQGNRVNTNIPRATLNIVGPVAVFHVIEENNPKTTEISPVILAMIAIWIGVEDKFLEAAAGKSRRPVINKIPTIFIDSSDKTSFGYKRNPILT